jgi:hypothetical protein
MASPLEVSIGPLLDFLAAAPLTDSIAALEYALEGTPGREVAAVLSKQGVDDRLLAAGPAARQQFGRIDDLIHATAISLALPRLLEPGERLRRPSLGAGNDPTRPYDVETDKRIAEFKLSRWDAGSNAMRKRNVFKDLVHLAAAPRDGRQAELYVLGPRPGHFLNTTKSKARWALNPGSDKTRDVYVERFGDLDTPIPDFVHGAAAHVKVIDLETSLPELFAAKAIGE